MSILEHQIVHSGPEQPFVTLTRNDSAYETTISVTLAYKPPQLIQIA